MLMGTDWDDADNPAMSYQLQQERHDDHPELRMVLCDTTAEFELEDSELLDPLVEWATWSSRTRTWG